MELHYQIEVGGIAEISVLRNPLELTSFRDSLDNPLVSGLYTMKDKNQIYSISNIRTEQRPAGKVHCFDVHSEEFTTAFITPLSGDNSAAYRKFAKQFTPLDVKDNILRRKGVKTLKQILEKAKAA